MPILEHDSNDVFEEPVKISVTEALSSLRLIKVNDQVRRLQTIIRDKTSSRSDFVFNADRLIRLVIEEGLNLLPYSTCQIETHSDIMCNGIRFDRGNCGVSIVRSGEAMEQGLRDCCRSIRIGKILIQSEDDTQQAKVFYAKLPPDIHRRKVLLMYPILSSGNTVLKAVDVLNEHSVPDHNIILLTLFCAPEGVHAVASKHPNIRILTSEVHENAPIYFGKKYFGTD
uniref:uracil phosphoribosyltransferase homolog n=1 Tax=Styela clava TaxID=7725 RepID=UPI00193AB17E|nr:uracil phosphoribosyltransferase homolog [Styela clava]